MRSQRQMLGNHSGSLPGSSLASTFSQEGRQTLHTKPVIQSLAADQGRGGGRLSCWKLSAEHGIFSTFLLPAWRSGCQFQEKCIPLSSDVCVGERGRLEVKLQGQALSTCGKGNRRAGQADETRKTQKTQLQGIPLLRNLKYPFTCSVKSKLFVWLVLFPPSTHFPLRPREELSAQPSSSAQPLQNHHFPFLL